MSSEKKYYCWGSDHQDLTKEVEQQAGDGGVEVFQLTNWSISFDVTANSLGISPQKKPGEKRIMVECDKGHMNIFVVKG